jgi:hypothetical protein
MDSLNITPNITINRRIIHPVNLVANPAIMPNTRLVIKMKNIH